jgi:hypothetical protein
MYIYVYICGRYKKKVSIHLCKSQTFELWILNILVYLKNAHLDLSRNEEVDV